MKKYISIHSLLAAFLLLLTAPSLFAQAPPESFNYQAAVRDNAGNILQSQAVSFRFSIIPTSAGGTAVYVETHSATTSALGLVALEVGTGTAVSGTFPTINWGSDSYFMKVELDETGGTSYTDMGTSQLRSVPYALHAKTVANDQVDDADADPANELQSLSLSGDTIFISNGNNIVLPSGTVDTDDQTLSISNDSLIIVDGNSVDLSPYLNTDAQTLSLVGTTIGITSGNTITLNVDDADANPSNEIQTLTKSGSTIFLSNGGASVTDDDSQTLTLSGSTLSISNGNSVTLTDNVNDADSDPSNEIQTISKSGSTVTLSNGGGSFIDDDTDADASTTNELQTISKSGSTVTLSNGGGSFTDAVNDADASATNELQTISKSGSTVTLSNGGGSYTDAVNDADASTSNELQSLSISGSTITLSSGGGSVTVPTSTSLWTDLGTDVRPVGGENVVSGGDFVTSGGNGVINCGGSLNAFANVIGDVAAPTITIATGDEDLFIDDDLEVRGAAYKTGGGSWLAISDKRLKRDIRPFEDGLEAVLKINPVFFKYNELAGPTDDREFVGVIAQDMLEVAPYTVIPSTLGRVEVELEDGGTKVINEGMDIYTYDGTAVDYMMVNAMKEMNAMMEAQAKKIEQLEKEIAELKANK